VKEEALAMAEATEKHWKSILDELRSELSGPAHETLRRSLPFVLDSESKGEQLCGFEQYLLDTVLTSSEKVLAKRAERLNESHLQLKEHRLKQEEAKKALQFAEETVAHALRQKEAAESRMSKADEWESEVTGNFMEVTCELQLLEKACEAAQKETEAFEQQVESLLRPLKDGSFDRSDWRNRNGAITRLLALLSPDTPRSLAEALQVAFKTDPAHREHVTKKAIEEGEKCLEKRSSELAAAREEVCAKLAATQNAAEKAQADLAKAEQECEEASKVLSFEESRYKEALADAEVSRSLVATLPEEESLLLASLAEAQESLEKIQIAAETFKSRTPSTPKSKSGSLTATATATATTAVTAAVTQAAETTPIKKSRREVDADAEEVGSDVSSSSTCSEKVRRPAFATKFVVAGKVANVQVTAKLAGTEDADAKFRSNAPIFGC